MSRAPSINPVTSAFGERVGGYHYGEDIGWDGADYLTLSMPADGTVIAYGARGNYGNRVDILTDNGDLIYLAHCDSFGGEVGSWYAEGTDIAVMGQTGRAYGRHCHWEVRRNGVILNPRNWLTEMAAIDIDLIEEEDEMRLLYVYWEGDSSPKGVIGTINRAFQTATERAHFINIWGTESAPKNGAKIGSVVTSKAFATQVLTMHTNSDIR